MVLDYFSLLIYNISEKTGKDGLIMAKKAQKSSPIEYIWEDRRRRLGMPLSFTRYKLSNDRLFLVKGFLNLKMEEVQLYRVRDISLRLSLWQRIFGVGTVTVNSSDQSMPVFELKNIKRPIDVKEMINEHVERVKIARNVRIGEVIDNNIGSFADIDHDGIPDEIDPHVNV